MRGKRHSTILRAALVLALAAVTIAGGCSHEKDPISYSRPSTDTTFQEGADRSPTPQTMYALATILAKQGKDDQCAFVLSRLIREAPDFTPAYVDMAQLHLRNNRTDEAVAVLSSGLEQQPEDTVLLNDLGMCWMLKRSYGLALEYFSQASALAPENARYRSNMAAAVGMMGRYDEALRLYMEVLPAADAHYNLSVICESRKDYGRAVREYNEAVALAEGPEEGSMVRPGSRPARRAVQPAADNVE